MVGTYGTVGVNYSLAHGDALNGRAERHRFGLRAARARAAVHEWRAAVGTVAATVAVVLAAAGSLRLAGRAFIHEEAWHR